MIPMHELSERAQRLARDPIERGHTVLARPHGRGGGPVGHVGLAALPLPGLRLGQRGVGHGRGRRRAGGGHGSRLAALRRRGGHGGRPQQIGPLRLPHVPDAGRGVGQSH